ncbi:MAG: hypothetical protein O3B24_05680 [Verrucomicrobia bacterium]|nr:hypothetical protein [Verrucomicrobiota bacterium]
MSICAGYRTGDRLAPQLVAPEIRPVYRRMTPPGVVCLLLLPFLGGCMCLGPEPPARQNTIDPVREIPATDEQADSLPETGRIDHAHARISAWVDNTAQGIDAFMLDLISDGEPSTNLTGTAAPPLETTKQKSKVAFSPSITVSDKDGTKFRNRFSAQLHLPNLQDRVDFVVNNIQDDEDVIQDVTDPFSRKQRVTGEDDKSAGLRFVLIDHLRFDLTAAGGLRFTPDPASKLRLRGRVRYHHGHTLYELQEAVFWQDYEGFGEKTTLTVTHAFTDRFSIRNSAAVLVEEATEGAVLGDTIALHYQFHRRRSLGMTFGMEWRTQPTTAVNTYVVRLPYRQGIWREWMYLRIEPGADFPDEDDYDMNPLITVGFDFYFGNGAQPRN